jgi:2',3'-cyclic-nucleotide 2'-phosphodiesterase (5'-nucleotidase family)
MVNSVSVNNPNTTKTSIFYINDVHSNQKSMQELKTASDAFDTFESSQKVDKLKFSAGDFTLGTSLPLNKLAVAVQNAMGIMATAGGNHECDVDRKALVEIMKDQKFKMLGMNVDISDKDSSDKQIREKLLKSYIQEQGGSKYGVIGLLPFDFHNHVGDTKEYSNFKIKQLDKVIPDIQKEIETLQQQGVNKIILLSHVGYESDSKLAQSLEGVDVIIGGHSHDLIKGITEGKNLFYSKKTGEPTIITQAGKDGKFFGVLNLEFNEKGVIKTAQNNVSETEAFPKSSLIKYLTEKLLGPSEVVGSVKTATGSFKRRLIVENPNASLLTDAMRSELNTDIAFLNAANLRDEFEVGKLTARDVKNITPFNNKMYTMTVSEKEIVDALKVGAKSMTNHSDRPGLIQVSGLKYKVNKAGELLDVKVIGKDKTEKTIDINNPSPSNKYTMAIDSFLCFGLGDSNSLAKIKPTQVFDFDKDKLACDYIKKQATPLEIKADGRIEIVD